MNVIRSVFFIFVLLCFCFWNFTNSQCVNEPCTLRSGKLGICKSSVQDCDLWELQKEGIGSCNSTGNNKMVCCPRPADSIVFPTDSLEEDNLCTPQSTNMRSESNSISSQKCMDYSKMKCRDTGSMFDIAHLIYNGKVVKSVEEFSHMALLGYNTSSGISWECGGTLISEQFILTAAHCLNSRDRSPISFARLGFLNRTINNRVSTVQEFQIIENIKHPNRTVRFRYDDIALLKLDRPVKLTSAVFPACLHMNKDIPAAEVQALGWGITENSGISEELRSVNLTVISHSECAPQYKTERKLPNGILEYSQFCAGSNNRDTCQGDSGGPLLIRHKNGCLNSVVGVTSIGIDCNVNRGKIPGVYARVSNYLPWIESIVWPK